MTMETLTIIQLIEVSMAYLCMTLFLPGLVLHRIFQQKPFSVRFIVYQMAGNFFMMNLVIVLELLHISYRVTLVFVTAIFFIVAIIKIYDRHPASDFKKIFEMLERLAAGQMGIRLFLRKVRDILLKNIKKILKYLFRELTAHFLDIMLLCGVLVALWHSYGVNLIRNFGYVASDMPVHNYWINYLGKNQIFVNGIYPFGMHCVVYYLRLVFGMPTYVVLRVFWFVQVAMIHFLLFAFMRCCCKSKYLPYAGLIIYILADFLGSYTHARYYSTLPQEFAMLFIFPPIYFLFAFLDRKEEDAISEKWYLGLFAISFSMTIAVHFYDTMAAGLLCIGVAIGYFFRVFRKKYFWKILLTGILSIVIAVLPMAAAFAMGTPLQGSLGWGLSVISGDNDDDKKTEEDKEVITGSREQEGDIGESISDDSELENETDSVFQTEVKQESKPSFTERAGSYAKRCWNALSELMFTVYMPQTLHDQAMEGLYNLLRLAVPLSVVFLFGFAVLFFLLRQADYGAKLMSVSAGMVALLLLFAAGPIGLPTLMDPGRASIFNAYLLPVAWTLCADAVLFLFFGWWKKTVILDVASFLLFLTVVFFLYHENLIRTAPDVKALQTNEAVTCLTNIIHDNPNFTWTIVSANDELRMVEDYGYHYELDKFLNRMENSGQYGEVYIPTTKVYVYIEKVPLDYMNSYSGSGQKISRWGARHFLPNAGGIGMYQGKNRWIEMSRTFYWAQAFQEAYPNELSVYFENENFVCYCITQDIYSLLNFSLDYGYNMKNIDLSGLD